MPKFILHTLRYCIGFLLHIIPAGKASDFLLWPLSRRLFGLGYSEIVSIDGADGARDGGLLMRAYGDMEDMVNKTLLFASRYQTLAWEPVTARFVKELSLGIKTAVVAGSHIGYYPLIIAENNKDAIVYAFEPNPKNYERFLENIRLNNFRNIEPHRAALGDKNGEQIMYFDFGQSSLLESNRKHSGKGTVSVLTLDDFFHDRSDKPDLLIFDAEGYEPNILRGAVVTIERGKPDIIFELNPQTLHAANSSPEALCKILLNKGYSIFIIDDDYNHSLSAKGWKQIRLTSFTGHLPDDVSFVNAFATMNPNRFRSYISP